MRDPIFSVLVGLGGELYVPEGMPCMGVPNSYVALEPSESPEVVG